MTTRIPFHFETRPVYRSLSKKAAYITGTSLLDVKTGALNCFLRRGASDRDEIVHVDLALPGGRTEDLGFFANRVTRRNKKRRAVYARSITASLPAALTEAQMIYCVKKYTHYLVGRYGVGVIVAIHRPPLKRRERPGAAPREDRDVPALNWHVHFLLSYCTVDEQGVLGTKQRLLDPTDCYQMRVQNFCDVERVRWQDATNEALELAESSLRVDHRTLLEQGSLDLPTRYCGPSVSAMMTKPRTTGAQIWADRSEPPVVMHNRMVRERNALRRSQLEAARASLQRHRDQRARALKIIDELIVAAATQLTGRQAAADCAYEMDDASPGDRAIVGAVATRSERIRWWQAITSAGRQQGVDFIDRRHGIVSFTDGGAIVKSMGDVILAQRGESGYTIDLLDDLRYAFAVQAQADANVLTNSSWVPWQRVRIAAKVQEAAQPISADEQRAIDAQFWMVRAVTSQQDQSAAAPSDHTPKVESLNKSPGELA